MARIRSGSEWAVNTTGIRPAHPVGQHVEERLVVVPVLDEDELGAPGEPRPEPLA